jgi:S-DNA-T family DNA segregation ATPase FtsK/SpoIIIE
MVDPKLVELTSYNGIPHLLAPVITDAKKTILMLKWAIKEMERRYEILQTEKVRDIESYHQNIYQPAIKKKAGDEDHGDIPEPLPNIVIVIDELADLMSAYPRELEACIVRLTQKSRAIGIHLIIATQRPEVKVITGLIKANMPTRLALKVNSLIDSRTIIDQSGAEKLLGGGDLLFVSQESSKPKRLQSPLITEGEMRKVVDYLKNQAEAHELDSVNLEGNNNRDSSPDAFFDSVEDGDDEDDLYEDAKTAVLEGGRASTSYLQRKLRVGYSRAARLMDILEERGVIGPQDGAKPREILMGDGSSRNDNGDEEV